jgi:hypothetical protein
MLALHGPLNVGANIELLFTSAKYLLKKYGLSDSGYFHGK